ncbi:MAG: hypothetical protein V8R94_08905 [Lachnospiraceae bacterium]
MIVLFSQILAIADNKEWDSNNTAEEQLFLRFRKRERVEENPASMQMPVILLYTIMNIEAVTGLKYIRFGMQRSIRKPRLVRTSM